MSKGFVAVSLLAVGLLAGLPAQASVIYTSRSSTITGFSCPSGGDCVEQTQTSTDLSAFSGSLSVPSDPDHWSSYRVSQQSTLTANQITVNMSAFKAQYDRDWSSFDLQFTVDAPTSFTMSGELGHSWSSGNALISLTGPSTFGIADVNCFGQGDYRRTPAWTTGRFEYEQSEFHDDVHADRADSGRGLVVCDQPFGAAALAPQGLRRHNHVKKFLNVSPFCSAPSLIIGLRAG